MFAGGFSALAAEEVCATDGLERSVVFSKLSHLVDKSLVAAHTDGDRTRYHLLEVVRQYAHQALVRSGEESTVRARHASFFVAFAEEAERGLDGPDQISWLARVARDHDNLRAALAWSLAQGGRSEIGLRLAGSLIAFWFIRGHLDEGERWLEQLVARAPTGPSEPKAKALIGAALLAAFQERYETAEQLATEGLELFRELDNTEGVAVAINALGTIAFAGQHTAVSLPDLLKEGRALRPRLTNRRLIAQTLDLEGGVALGSGDADRAAILWQQSLDISRQTGNAYGEAFTVSNLGLLAAARGDQERATDLLRQGLRLGTRLDYKLIIQYCLMGLAKVDATAGRLLRASRLWGAADRMSEAFGTQLTRAARLLIDYEAELAGARAQLGESAWSAAWSDGRSLTSQQVTVLALEPDAVELGTPRPTPGGLSDREVEVLALVAGGATNAEVAKSLFLSPRTVDWHLSSIYTKLRVRSRTEAALFAVEHHVV